MNSTIDISTSNSIPLLNETKVKTMKHIMLGLDKKSYESNAAISSISAVFFDPSTGEIEDAFYRQIDNEEDSDKYGTVSKSVILSGHPNHRAWGWFVEPVHALSHFSKWVETTALAGIDIIDLMDEGVPDITVWFDGASRDNLILSNAYKACNEPPLFRPEYYHDVRTVGVLGSHLRGITSKEVLYSESFAMDGFDRVRIHVCNVSNVYIALSECSSTCKVQAEISTCSDVFDRAFNDFQNAAIDGLTND